MHCRASSKAFGWALVSLDTPLKQCCRMEMHFNPGATNQYRQQTPAIPQHILMQFQSVIIKYIDSGCFWRLRVWPCFWIAYFLWKKTKLFRSTWTYPALSDVLQGPRTGCMPAPWHCGINETMPWFWAHTVPSPPLPAASILHSLNSNRFAVSGKSQEKSSCGSSRTVTACAHQARVKVSWHWNKP